VAVVVVVVAVVGHFFPGSSAWSLADGTGDSSAEQRPVSQVSTELFSTDPIEGWKIYTGELENVYWRMRYIHGTPIETLGATQLLYSR
jgi:hypothetical protein